MSIFRKYDVRGSYPDKFNEEKAKKIAKAFVKVKDLSGKKVAVGRDARNSSPQIANAVIEGLVDQGCDVVDIGTTATSVLYYEVVEDNLAGGAMVTASHNPKGDNGIRFCGKLGLDLVYEAGIKKMEEIHKSEFESKPRGQVIQRDVLQDFVDKISSSASIDKSFKVVVDPGNGSSALFAEDIFKSIGCEVVTVNSEVDGEFPARGPDPVENVGELGEMVVEEGADLGVAFDGDGDRGVFIDEKGDRVDNDVLLALFVKNLINQGDTVIHDVKSSKLVEDMVEEVGARDIPFRVGMSYIKREMIKREAELGGEYTGHFFFKDNDYYDDPYYAATKLLEIMDSKGKLSELVDKLPTYQSSPELRLACNNKEEVPGKLKKDFSDKKIVEKDGAKIYFDGGWALVRPSGTEDKVSIRFEADTEKDLDEIREKVMRKVEEYIKK
ncbi:MAG: phosphomannomutase/phosphoglucomutase [Candidatus Aenigmatarchaeota archaeon]